MSAEESFLVRWARRKRAAATDTSDQPQPKDAGDGAAAVAAAAVVPPEKTQSHVDPESLPPIETIDAGSDIRPFLATGVPADLTRAALRRAWSADPAIRDFIGLSENSWDFNAPGGVPGFGSLAMENARQLLAQAVEEAKALAPSRPATERLAYDRASVTDGESGRTTTGSVADQTRVGRNLDTDPENPMPRDGKNDLAVHHEREERKPRRPALRRRHGSALPD